MRSYKFTYDKSDKLATAVFQAYGTSSWDKEVNTLNESLNYDHNGNVLTLGRNQNLRSLSGTTVTNASQVMDNLVYTYTANRVTGVEDSALPAGFNNGKVAGTDEYTYAADGRLTKDDNKNITAITYNELGKPAQVTFNDGRSIAYTYDMAGTKLKMSLTQGTTTNVTDYVQGFVYVNNNLSFFDTKEGRIVKTAGGSYDYQYAITDQQGNNRVLFSAAAPPVVPSTATFGDDPGDDSDEFTNITAGNVVTSAAANHTTGGTKAVRMNQTYKIGPSRSVAVFPGDKVDISVWEYHEGASGFGTSATPTTTLVNMVASSFGGVSGAAGDPGLIYNGVNSGITAFVPGGNQGDSRPAAYLNYILFDNDYKILDMGWQLAPATTFTKQQMAFNNLTVKEAGHLFVYLSYDDDSNNWVYFDDLNVTHTQTRVIQYNEYYPFGLQTAKSWTREEATANNYLYNEGSELNTVTGLYELDFRSYDPALARMNQIDPLADKFAGVSPYSYAFNSPMVYNDPSGALPPTTVFGRAVWDTGTAGGPADGGGDFGGFGGFGVGGFGGYGGFEGFGGGGITNPGFSGSTWAQIGGVVNFMFSNTDPSNGISHYQDGQVNFFTGGPNGYAGGTGAASDHVGATTVLSMIASTLSDNNGWSLTAHAGFDSYAAQVAGAMGIVLLRDVTVMETRINPDWLQTRIDEVMAQDPVQQNPLQQSHGEPIWTIAEFREANRGLTRERVINQRPGRGPGQPGGPNMRYVRNPMDNNVVDMRHMLIVGPQGGLVGGTIEVGQWIAGQESGMDPQDFYSNGLGLTFNGYLRLYKLGDTSQYVEYLYNFFTTRHYYNTPREKPKKK
jgi:RHS repeat-associated protein